MVEPNQLSFSELDVQFSRAELRAWEDYQTRPMWPWLKMLRSVGSRLAETYQRRDNEIYQQLMLLEEEIQAGRDKAVVLERIGRAKGLLAVLFLVFVAHGMVAGVVGGGEPLRRPQAGVRVVRLERSVA